MIANFHVKAKDLAEIKGFLKSLLEFQKLKRERWEKIDGFLQMHNPPGTPGEDWIIPPDEKIVAKELDKDSDYRELKRKILAGIPRLKAIAHFLNFNDHHDFDWIKFTSPLIGNDAIEGGLRVSYELEAACKEKNYFLQNLRSLF